MSLILFVAAEKQTTSSIIIGDLAVTEIMNLQTSELSKLNFGIL